MARKIYAGADGVAKKVRRAYIGVEGVARKIKRIYTGVDGVARQTFSSSVLATPLTRARAYLGGASAGTSALFAGGTNGAAQNKVDVYSSSLAQSTDLTLMSASEHLAAATTEKGALFIAPLSKTSTFFRTDVSKVNIGTLNANGSHPAATAINNIVVFGGGRDTSDNATATSRAYNTDNFTTNNSVPSLTVARYDLAAATIGNFALLTGGHNGSAAVATVDAYDASVTRSTPTALSQARHSLSATTVGNYALFAGGKSGSTVSFTVDAYNTSLTRSTPATLSKARFDITAITVGGKALFAGGKDNTNYYYTVDAYNSSLTRSVINDLDDPRAYFAAATAGDYALFAGGYDGNKYFSTVDVYTAQST